MPAITAVCDANVLYPAPLRDLLMRLAVEDFFHPRWTETIHDEWIRNVLKNRPDLTRDQLNRTRDLMNRHANGCLVVGYESLIPALQLPDPDDRHVLAAAIVAKAQVIVTFNLQDFPDESLAAFGMCAQHPDAFLVGLLDSNEAAFCRAVRKQRAALSNPPFDVPQLLATLSSQRLPMAVERLQLLASRL